jgi:hypothetical protein
MVRKINSKMLDFSISLNYAIVGQIVKFYRIFNPGGLNYQNGESAKIVLLCFINKWNIDFPP